MTPPHSAARHLVRGVAGASTIVTTAVVAALAQTPARQRPPVFRGESVLVTVDVYPHRDGRIVEGLTASDFEVREDGRPQAIETVEFVRVEAAPGAGDRRDPATVQDMRSQAADPHNRVFVVYLDGLHVSVDGSHRMRRPLIDWLDSVIAPADLFGIVTHHTAPRALTLGRRRDSVEEQLTKYWAWGERNRLGLDPDDPMEDALKACFEFKPVPGLPPWLVSDNGQERYLYEVLVDRRREDRTLTSLEALADYLTGLREARTVVLMVSDG